MGAIPGRFRSFTSETESMPRGGGKTTYLLYHTRDETEGDFVISRNLDDIDFPAINAIPLWLLGMTY